MAVDIPVQTPVSVNDGPIAANAADLTFTAATLAGNQCSLTGRELVIVKNDDAAAQTISFESVPDKLGREGDITAYSVGAAELAIFGPFSLEGWDQAGKLLFTASDVDVKIAVVRIPYV